MIFCSDACKSKSSEYKNFLVTQNIFDLCRVESFMKTRYIVLVQGTVIQSPSCANYSEEKEKKKPSVHQEKSNCPVKMVILDFRLTVVKYRLLDFIFTRLSLL